MQMSAEQRIEASPETVWTALNDIEVLRHCIPGCEAIERLSDTELAASVMARVGPVKARFKGKVLFSDIDPPHGYRISGEGQGGAAGFARGGASVRLRPDGNATLLAYDVDAAVGGKLAQIGSRLVDGAARKFAEEFFDRFQQLVTATTALPPTVAVPARAVAAEAATERSLPPVVWVPGLILAVLLLLFLFAGAGRLG